MAYGTSFRSDIDKTLNGGKGSGDWGHAGRPGKVGGSAPKTVRATSTKADRERAIKQLLERKPDMLTKAEWEKTYKEAYDRADQIDKDTRENFVMYSIEPGWGGSSHLNKDPYSPQIISGGTEISPEDFIAKYKDSEDPKQRELAEKAQAYLDKATSKAQYNRRAKEVWIDPFDNPETMSNIELRDYYTANPDKTAYDISKPYPRLNWEGDFYSTARHGNMYSEKNVAEQRSVDNGIKKYGTSLDKPITVERRVPEEAINFIKGQLKEKRTYTQEGFTSTSAQPMTAKGGNVSMNFGSKKIKIIVPAGNKFFVMSSLEKTSPDMASVHEQYEFLFPSGMKYTALNDLKPDKDGNYWLRMEEYK